MDNGLKVLLLIIISILFSNTYLVNGQENNLTIIKPPEEVGDIMNNLFENLMDETISVVNSTTLTTDSDNESFKDEVRETNITATSINTSTILSPLIEGNLTNNQSSFNNATSHMSDISKGINDTISRYMLQFKELYNNNRNNTGYIGKTVNHSHTDTLFLFLIFIMAISLAFIYSFNRLKNPKLIIIPSRNADTTEIKGVVINPPINILKIFRKPSHNTQIDIMIYDAVGKPMFNGIKIRCMWISRRHEINSKKTSFNDLTLNTVFSDNIGEEFIIAIKSGNGECYIPAFIDSNTDINNFILPKGTFKVKVMAHSTKAYSVKYLIISNNDSKNIGIHL